MTGKDTRMPRQRRPNTGHVRAIGAGGDHADGATRIDADQDTSDAEPTSAEAPHGRHNAWTVTNGWSGPDMTEGPDGDEGGFLGDPEEEVPSEPDRAVFSPPGHYVMDRSAISAALRASGFDGTYDALSSGEEQRIRTLLQHRSADLFKPHLIGSQAMTERLEALDPAAANFGPVTRIVQRAAIVSQRAGSALRVSPVVLVGSPGIGKSRYARLLAEALRTSCNIVNGSTLPDVGSLTGYPPVWRGSGAGRIAKFLTSSATSGPLIVVDEAEKIRDFEAMSNPLDRLLPLLEYDTASSYQDEALQVPMRAQHAIILFACNTLEGLSAPFLDRTVVIEVPDLTPEQRDEAYAALLETIATERGLRLSLASTAALASIRALGMRRARLAFDVAIGYAVEANRSFLTAADLAAAAALLGTPDDRRPIGFIQRRADHG